MIINTIQELRLYFPAHALSNIESLAGFIDNSEHDFLLEKIGDGLYDKIAEFYTTVNPEALAESVRLGEKQDYYTQLLLCCQRCVVFDAFSRAISVQAVSVSNMGVNVATADDYGKADKDSIDAFRQTCVKEAHAAVNRLLVTLEKWTKENAALDSDVSPVLSKDESERREIVQLWRQSRYYFLAASLLIPSAEVLQQYLNIYDSREKFIQMLPDLSYIQDENIEPVVGEELLGFLAEKSITGTSDPILCRVISILRKAMAAWLEERTTVIKTTSERRKAAHNEAERHCKRVVEYIKLHTDSFPEDVIEKSPFKRNDDEPCVCPQFKNNERDSVMFVTPTLN